MSAPRQAKRNGASHSITKALRLLGLFAEGRADLGLTEAAALAALPKGTTHRILIALEHEGFLLQGPDSRNWGLGFQVVHLYQACREQWACVRVAIP